MSSATSERALLHRITRELDAAPVGPQDLPNREVPTSSGESLRPAAHQLRASVPPVKRQAYLRNAIQRLGGHLVRFGRGQTYKATVGSRVYVGTFAEVFDQVAPLVLRHLDPCL